MHPASWVAWLALVMSVSLTTSNPLYLVVVLLAILLVAAAAPRTGQPAVGFLALMAFGLGVFVMSFLVAIVNGSYGDHILFTVPGPNIPEWLGGLRIGGPVSAEGLVAAGIRGLSIFCVFAAFATFNRSVLPQRVLRTAPAALFQAGLVVTVGLALLPATLADVRRINEVRSLRGAPSGFRAVPSLLVPALIGGLDRAMRTAEAMEARGYAASDPLPGSTRLLLAAAPPALLVAAWLWFFYPDWKWAGAGAAVAGVFCIAAGGIIAARNRKTTRLRSEPYPSLERAVALGSVVGAAALVLGGGLGLELDYNPFAGLPPPPFSPVGAVVGLICAWPALAFIRTPTRVAPPAGLPAEQTP